MRLNKLPVLEVRRFGGEKQPEVRIARCVLVVLLLANFGCGSGSPFAQNAPQAPVIPTAPPKLASQEYLTLLAKYPEDRQGEGLDSSFGTVAERPATYAVVLSSEVLHFRASPNEEGRRRIHKAVRWLLDNIDLDKDGKPGWGLADAWDAFSDGTVNPAHHPYTITTALVLWGLLDGVSLPGFWTEAEREEIRRAIVSTSLRWCHEVWEETASGGYFWYSPTVFDSEFVPNVSAALLGGLSRLVVEQRGALTQAEYEFIQARVLAAAEAIVESAQFRDGAPFWYYSAGDPNDPNDLGHHIIILWSMELYRGTGNPVPWTNSQAIESLDRFWRSGSVYDYPQDVTYVGNQASFQDRPGVLPAVGALVGYYARWADAARTSTSFDYLQRVHGPWPDLRLWPATFSSDTNFYSGSAVWALWGVALRDFV